MESINKVKMVSGVVTVNNPTKDGVSTVYVKIQRPIFVGSESKNVNLMESIHSFMEKTACSEADILWFIEYASDLKIRSQARQTVTSGGCGKMTDQMQQQIFCEHIGETDFQELVKTVGPKQACLKYADKTEISSIGEDEAGKIAKEALLEIKRLHELV
jgi:hypothetical protein